MKEVANKYINLERQTEQQKALKIYLKSKQALKDPELDGLRQTHLGSNNTTINNDNTTLNVEQQIFVTKAGAPDP
jgi:hypothetical protein